MIALNCRLNATPSARYNAMLESPWWSNAIDDAVPVAMCGHADCCEPTHLVPGTARLLAVAMGDGE